MTVVALHTDVLLDGDAVDAERRALVAELAAERFGAIHLHRDGRPYAQEVEAARHLERAAELARQVAAYERRRCTVAGAPKSEASGAGGTLMTANADPRGLSDGALEGIVLGLDGYADAPPPACRAAKVSADDDPWFPREPGPGARRERAAYETPCAAAVRVVPGPGGVPGVGAAV